MEMPICSGAVIGVSQHARGQVLESNPSPSPFFPQFPMIFFFSGRRRTLLRQRSLQSAIGARWSFCFGSLMQKIVSLVSPTFLPRIVSPLTFQSSSSACNEVNRLFCCVEEPENAATPVICVLQDVPTETSRFSGLSKFSTNSIFTLNWAHFSK